MLRGSLWGRPRWNWALDVVVIVLFLIVYWLSDNSTIRLIAIAAIVLRVVTALIPVLVWRFGARRREAEARSGSPRR